MAEAALQTITTLQKMLDEKNIQLKNKDELVNKMRRDLLN
jgi:hypothetical protein